MGEVTQADREAAAGLMAEQEIDGSWSPAVRNGEDDGYPLVRAFARHREAERAAIVALIGSWFDLHAKELPDIAQALWDLKSAIERGDHLGEGG